MVVIVVEVLVLVVVVVVIVVVVMIVVVVVVIVAEMEKLTFIRRQLSVTCVRAVAECLHTRLLQVGSGHSETSHH